MYVFSDPCMHYFNCCIYLIIVYWICIWINDYSLSRCKSYHSCADVRVILTAVKKIFCMPANCTEAYRECFVNFSLKVCGSHIWHPYSYRNKKLHVQYIGNCHMTVTTTGARLSRTMHLKCQFWLTSFEHVTMTGMLIMQECARLYVTCTNH